MLENKYSRDVFEKTSSMSAKLTKSISDLNCQNEFIKFPFDSVLLESKVYRRACESSWIREVRTALNDGDESNSSGTASIMSISSNSAIASEEDGASLPGDLDVNFGRHGVIEPENIPCVKHKGKYDDREVLKISDPGPDELHHPHTDATVPEPHGGTETCKAPELKDHSREHRLPSTIDMLIMISAAVQLSCWLASTKDQLEAFNLSGYARLPKSLASGPGTSNNKFQIQAKCATRFRLRRNVVRLL